MALGLEVKGMINIQYIVRNNEVYVIEVNPRSSRTVPFLSKVTNVPMINVATKAAMGYSTANRATSLVWASSPTIMQLKRRCSRLTK